MTRFLIGTSGWMYSDWNGVFYPKTVTGVAQLPYYSEHFPTVEINSTFYHMPKPATAAHWREVTPADFCFAIKMNRYLSHTKRLILDADSQKSLDDFVTSVAELHEKLGIVLVQLPPSLRCDVPRLEAFIIACNTAAKNHAIAMPLALEFRHASWFNNEVHALLKAHGIAQVINDSPNRWPSEKVVPADTAYIRFHGSKQLYRSSYSDEELAAWATFMRTSCGHCKTIFAFFNNDYHAVAVANAQSLTKLVAMS